MKLTLKKLEKCSKLRLATSRPRFSPINASADFAPRALLIACTLFPRSSDSPYYKICRSRMQLTEATKMEFLTMKGIFLAPKSGYDGSYLFKLDTAVRGDLCCFVLLAKSALENNQKDVAAVLASAALEDALKRYASLHGLDVAGKEMQDVINALKQKVWCQVPKKVSWRACPRFVMLLCMLTGKRLPLRR